MRLIDADPIMQDLEEWMKDPNRDPDAKSVVDHMGGIIRTSPTVDAEPVRHGHWEIKPLWKDAEGEYCECSVCHHPVWWATDYCPRCGAKMDEEEEVDE